MHRPVEFMFAGAGFDSGHHPDGKVWVKVNSLMFGNGYGDTRSVKIEPIEVPRSLFSEDPVMGDGVEVTTINEWILEKWNRRDLTVIEWNDGQTRRVTGQADPQRILRTEPSSDE